MRNLKLIGSSNKFTAIPEGCGRFLGDHVNDGGDQEYYPAGDDVGLFGSWAQIKLI